MRPFGRVIASRQLARRNRKPPLLIEIGIPRRRRAGEWECQYRIRGLRPLRPRRALGEDSVQALELVFQAIRLELEQYGRDLSWTGEPGDVGFHRFFPDVLGSTVSRRIGRLIDRELAKEGKRLASRHRRSANSTKKSRPAAA
jgi:hypothetical protein